VPFSRNLGPKLPGILCAPRACNGTDLPFRWGKLRNEELYDLFLPPDTVRLTQSWSLIGVGHVRRKGQVDNCRKICWRNRIWRNCKRNSLSENKERGVDLYGSE